MEKVLKGGRINFRFLNKFSFFFSVMVLKDHSAVVCGDSRDDDVTRIKSGESKMFYKSCWWKSTRWRHRNRILICWWKHTWWCHKNRIQILLVKTDILSEPFSMLTTINFSVIYFGTIWFLLIDDFLWKCFLLRWTLISLSFELYESKFQSIFGVKLCNYEFSISKNTIIRNL